MKKFNTHNKKRFISVILCIFTITFLSSCSGNSNQISIPKFDFDDSVIKLSITTTEVDYFSTDDTDFYQLLSKEINRSTEFNDLNKVDLLNDLEENDNKYDLINISIVGKDDSISFDIFSLNEEVYVKYKNEFFSLSNELLEEVNRIITPSDLEDK